MALVKNKDWQLVLSNTPNQVVLYHTPTKSLKVAAVTASQSHTEAGNICPTCLQPLHAQHTSDNSNGSPTPTTTKYFRLLSSLDDTSAANSPPKRNSITANTYPSPYQSHPDDISTARIDGYYAKFFVDLRQIGRGAYASVHLCQHTLNGNLLGLYAVKKVAVGLSSSYLKRALQEVKLLENLRHPHIVDYHHSWVELTTLTQFGPDVPTLYLLMSFANGGSLAHLIKARQGGSTEKEEEDSSSGKQAANKEDLIAEQRKQRDKRKVGGMEKATSDRRKSDTRSIHYFRTDELIVLFKNITDGLEFLVGVKCKYADTIHKLYQHSKGIMHLDLKPANVLLNWDDSNDMIPRAMLSDFGSSFTGADDAQRTGQTGTMEYTSPEALHVDANGRLSQERSFKNDIWSLGMILYEMIFFTLPWQSASANDYDLLSKEILSYKGFDEDAIKGGVQARPAVPISIMHLLAKLLDRDAGSRPLAYKVLEEVERIERVTQKEVDRTRVFDIFSNSQTQSQVHTSSIRSGPLPELVRPTILPSMAVNEGESEKKEKGRSNAAKEYLKWVIVVAGVLIKTDDVDKREDEYLVDDFDDSVDDSGC